MSIHVQGFESFTSCREMITAKFPKIGIFFRNFPKKAFAQNTIADREGIKWGKENIEKYDTEVYESSVLESSSCSSYFYILNECTKLIFYH